MTQKSAPYPSLELHRQQATFLEFQQGRDVLLPGLSWLRPRIARVLQGHKEIHSADRVVRVKPGELIWIPGGLLVDVKNIPSNGLYRAEVLSLSPELFTQLPIAPHAETGLFPCLISLCGAPIQEAWERVVAGYKENLPTTPKLFRVLELLAWVQSTGIQLSSARPAFHQRLLEQFSSDPGKDWRLSGLSRDLAMSEDTLQRRLARENTTFRSVLQEARLCKALTLLQTTDHHVSWIAEEVGFTSASHFALRFRARFGVSPSQIR